MKRMREKLFWAAVLILGVTLAASRAQTPAPATGMPRFQLFAAEYYSVNQGGAGRQPAVFRIDTATGATAIFEEVHNADMYVSFWRPVDEQKVVRKNSDGQRQ